MLVFYNGIMNSYAQQLTYYKDVQPVIQNKCAPCHRQGESAPFSLLEYEDVKKRVSFIKEVIQSGYMPPWKADNKYVHFTNDRSLTTIEKNTIIKWINSNAPAGTAVNKPGTQKILAEGTMYKRKPDLTLKATDS